MKNQKFFKTVTATALTVAMAASNLMLAVPVTTLAADDAAPAPFWQVDFNNGYDDLQKDSKFEVVENEGGASMPELVKETVGGKEIQVLQLKKSSGDEVRGADSTGANVLKGYANNSTIKMSNPFASLGTDYFKEYEWYEDVTLTKHNGMLQPLWTKGASLNYWIKVPAEEGKDTGINSSLFTWALDDYQFQADDYAKYLTIHYYDITIENLIKDDPEISALATQEEKEAALKAKYGPSMVPKGSDYWFDYQVKDDNGNPIMFEDYSGQTGPVYGTASYVGTFGRWFNMNRNYVRGFKGNDDSDYTYMYEDAYHQLGFDTLPTVVQPTEEDADGSYSCDESVVRFAKVHSCLQIDSDSSIYWVNDNNTGKNLNKNHKASFGTIAGMQNGDRFFMNSWTGSDTQKAEDAMFLADSPYAAPDKWHMVTVTFMNDWVEFYLDGKCVDVEANYGSRGGASLDKGQSFKRFNKGVGMRGGFGSEKTKIGNIYYGNYVCRLFLDWLTNPMTTFTIGGVSEYASEYNVSIKNDDIMLAKVQAYSVPLDEDQIADIYAQGMAGVTYGDVDGNGKVDATDALEVLKAAVKITTLDETQKKAADTNGDNKVDANDALNILKYVVKLISELPVK